MSTQNRTSGGGGTVRNQKKSNANSGGISGNETITHATSNNKKSEVTKTEKEKIQPKPTPEQLRIAQITNSNAAEDPQLREKVATLLEMTQRSEEEVCCALYECDNNMERAVVFLLETLPVGAFETSSKKKKKQASTAAGQEGTAISGDVDGWNDGNANSSSDKREKSRNRSSNRGGRGGTDSRGWRGREARENERNIRESRSSGFGGGYGNGERDDRGGNREDRGGQRSSGMSSRRGGGGDGSSSAGGGHGGSGRGGGYAGRTGRGGGRMGGRMSGLGRSDRGTGGGPGSGGGAGVGYGNSRQNTTNDEHQEVELWDNTIAQNAEKQNHTQDDAWGDWDNEEYVGSLKDSKVFTTSNLPNQTTASVVSGGLQVSGVPGNDALSAPPGLESHLGGVPNSPNVVVNDDSIPPLPTTPMQYSAAVTGVTPVQQQQQQQALQLQQQTQNAAVTTSNSGLNVNAPQYNNVIADTFTNAANAAANLVQQVQAQQQAQTQLKAAASATLSAEQSQYFNSLTSQNTAGVGLSTGGVVAPQQPLTPQMNTYAQSAAAAVTATAATGVQYPTTYANVFGTTAAGGNNNTTPVGLDHQQQPMQQVRRPRAKLPPPSKIPATAVEMPGDSLNNMGYIDVQFGGLDFGTDDSFDALSDKFNSSVTIENQTQQQQQQLVQSGQEVNSNDYQNKAGVVPQQNQTSLTASLQNAQLPDTLNSGYATQRGATMPQQPQQQVVGSSPGNVGASTLEHLTKNEHVYNQANVNNTGGYQSAYQTSANNKVGNNAYQQSTAAQAYSSNAYGNVQASVANSYQAQAYSSYQQNAVNSYQQQAGNSVPGAVNNGAVNSNSSQNIPVGGSNSNNAAANSNSGYLSTGYPTQQNAYQTSQSVYGGTGLSNSSGFAGSSNNSNSQYSNFSTSAKLKDGSNTSTTSHFESVTTNNVSGVAVNATTGPSANSVGVNNSNANSGTTGSTGSSQSNSNANSVSNANANNVSSSVASSAVAAVVANKNSGVSAIASTTSGAGTTGSASGSGGMVPNIQMVSQYIQTGLPYYQQPVYSYEELPMMQQRVPHVQGYYDLNYTPTSLGAGRDNLGSVAYSTMTDGRFARTDNNSSPVSNQVSSTMSQQAGSSGPMLNVPYYFYGGNMVPGSFQYGTPAIYSQQIPAPNTGSSGQFAKPSYNTGYGSTSYDALSQASQDYTKGGYPSSVNPPNKPQNVSNQPPAGTGTDIASSMYGKGHVALNKVNSYEKQNFHSGTPPPFMPNTQTAGGTSAQPYGMYLPMPATAPHHNIMHQPIHQMDGRIHNSSRRDSNSTGQRQQSNSQSKAANKQGYSPSYWTGQN